VHACIWVLIVLICISLSAGLDRALKEHAMARDIIVRETITELEQTKTKDWDTVKKTINKVKKDLERAKGTPEAFLKKCKKCEKELPVASEECPYCKTKQE